MKNTPIQSFKFFVCLIVCVFVLFKTPIFFVITFAKQTLRHHQPNKESNGWQVHKGIEGGQHPSSPPTISLVVLLLLLWQTLATTQDFYLFTFCDKFFTMFKLECNLVQDDVCMGVVTNSGVTPIVKLLVKLKCMDTIRNSFDIVGQFVW